MRPASVYVIFILHLWRVTSIRCEDNNVSKQQLSDIESAISRLLSGLGEDITRGGLVDTPKRFAKQIEEFLTGYNENPKRHVKLFDSNGFHDLIVVSRITFGSLCEHHLLPFYGYVDIAYVPTDKILGLSKFARIVDVYSRRLQVQEGLTKELADFLQKHLQPELIIVRINAQHSCMTIRGVLRPESLAETVVVLGDSRANKHHIDYFQNMTKRSR